MIDITVTDEFVDVADGDTVEVTGGEFVSFGGTPVPDRRLLPNTVGEPGQIPAVNDAGTAVEYVDAAAGTGTEVDYIATGVAGTVFDVQRADGSTFSIDVTGAPADKTIYLVSTDRVFTTTGTGVDAGVLATAGLYVAVTDGFQATAVSSASTDGVLTFPVGGGSGTPFDGTPADLGTADPGTSDEYARGDHVHALPTPADIGAAVEGGNIDGSQIQSGTVPWIHLPSTVAEEDDITNAIAAHLAATDPHEDRAYADGLFASVASVASEVRHDFVSPNDYMGTAPSGSATSASVWSITRLAISSAGATTATHATGVKWDDRLTATYT